jgi:hypothetical protein
MPDPALGRAFYLGGFDGARYSSITSVSLSGIVAFDTNSYLPSGLVTLNLPAFEPNAATTPVDVIRWGQDGLAALMSSGNIYLVRGAAVVPQLLQTSSPPVISGISSSSLVHGSGNIVLTLTGSNFLPGLAVTWNGSYRTTNWSSATQVTVDIPASDLAAPGTASIAATNPGSANSPAMTVTIN